jgi:hypothetical protein
MPKGHPNPAATDAVVAAALARIDARPPRPRSARVLVTIEHRRDGQVRAYTASPSKTAIMDPLDRVTT